jgi:hypothetical protein
MQLKYFCRLLDGFFAEFNFGNTYILDILYYVRLMHFCPLFICKFDEKVALRLKFFTCILITLHKSITLINIREGLLSLIRSIYSFKNYLPKTAAQ